MKPLVTFILISISFLVSCDLVKNEEVKADGEALAQVGNNYLYMSEIKEMINPSGEKDSSKIIENYINSWIRKQLVLEKAQEQLTSEIEDIDKKVQDYRESLIIYRYEQELIKQKLDTSITQNEIEEYYKNYTNNFILESDIFDVAYLKMAGNSPSRNTVIEWFKSPSMEDQAKLEDFCSQYAIVYNINSVNWNNIASLKNILNIDTDLLESSLYNQSYITLEPGDHFIIIHVRDKRLKGSEAPLDYVREDIKKILLNKRKLSMIDDIHNRILEDGQNQNKYKIFYN